MAELKTLKDLPYFQKGMSEKFVNLQCESSGDMIEIRELRQEAIKYIKACLDYQDGIKCSTCEWIKMFFNLTEEDLK